MPGNRCEIDPEQCKGCGVCVENCPRKCLVMGDELNGSGYRYARFAEQRCTACGICFYVCPEPGAITVYRAESEGRNTGDKTGTGGDRQPERGTR